MIFVDSSGFIAAFDARDGAYARVAEVWRELAARRTRLLTTQLVFAETVTHLRRRAGWQVANRVGDAILRSDVIEVVGLDNEQLAAAWRELSRSGDSKLSLCDAASFVWMRQRTVTHALTLDRHFVEAGFEILPRAAG